MPEPARQSPGRTAGSCARLLPALLALLLAGPGMAAAASDGQFTNPILPGAHPDPSICRDGENFYLVNSSFEWYPGLPIHHSRDLVNWELIGHGLHRGDQVTGAVNLLDVQSDGGIHAPSIRCHAGRYYIITTNVYQPPEAGAETEFVNFVLTADDPAGPWSEPRVLEGAPGIDPDLFFDDDGRVWYVGTHSPSNPAFPGEGEIWLQEVDPSAWRLVGERHFLWRGACGGTWAEGPHLYKRDGRYYLLVAEGGTHFNHAVMVAAADEITGPYASNPRNPILSSRHLGYDYWVNSVGHADLVELPDGRWYAVTLGIRGDEQRASNMGRETHLVPVTWEREPFWWKEDRIEWPVAAPLTGRVERRTPLPFADRPQRPRTAFADSFDHPELDLQWTFRRYPEPGSWSLSAREGYLRLAAVPTVLAERSRAAFVGFRQTESDFSYEAVMEFRPAGDGSEAGLAVVQKDANWLALTVRRQGGNKLLRVVLAEAGPNGRDPAGQTVLAEAPLPGDAARLVLRIVSEGGRYRYDYSLDDGAQFRALYRGRADRVLSRGYTGALLGLYATGNGRDTGDVADFDRVDYRATTRVSEH